MEQDIPFYIDALLRDVRSPEAAISFGLGATKDSAAQGDAWSEGTDALRERVHGFNLDVGPADQPAFYDFHELRIAFDHVWQEAIDEGAIDLAEDAYQEVVELGGDPDLATLEALNREARLITRARHQMASRGATAHQTGKVGNHRESASTDPTGLLGIFPFVGIKE